MKKTIWMAILAVLIIGGAAAKAGADADADSVSSPEYQRLAKELLAVKTLGEKATVTEKLILFAGKRIRHFPITEKENRFLQFLYELVNTLEWADRGITKRFLNMRAEICQAEMVRRQKKNCGEEPQDAWYSFNYKKRHENWEVCIGETKRDILSEPGCDFYELQ